MLCGGDANELVMKRIGGGSAAVLGLAGRLGDLTLRGAVSARPLSLAHCRSRSGGVTRVDPLVVGVHKGQSDVVLPVQVTGLLLCFNSCMWCSPGRANKRGRHD